MIKATGADLFFIGLVLLIVGVILTRSAQSPPAAIFGLFVTLIGAVSLSASIVLLIVKHL